MGMPWQDINQLDRILFHSDGIGGVTGRGSSPTAPINIPFVTKRLELSMGDKGHYLMCAGRASFGNVEGITPVLYFSSCEWAWAVLRLQSAPTFLGTSGLN